jgi:hypothetical protein
MRQNCVEVCKENCIGVVRNSSKPTSHHPQILKPLKRRRTLCSQPSTSYNLIIHFPQNTPSSFSLGCIALFASFSNIPRRNLYGGVSRASVYEFRSTHQHNQSMQYNPPLLHSSSIELLSKQPCIRRRRQIDVEVVVVDIVVVAGHIASRI